MLHDGSKCRPRVGTVSSSRSSASSRTIHGVACSAQPPIFSSARPPQSSDRTPKHGNAAQLVRHEILWLGGRFSSTRWTVLICGIASRGCVNVLQKTIGGPRRHVAGLASCHYSTPCVSNLRASSLVPRSVWSGAAAVLRGNAVKVADARSFVTFHECFSGGHWHPRGQGSTNTGLRLWSDYFQTTDLLENLHHHLSCMVTLLDTESVRLYRNKTPKLR